MGVTVVVDCTTVYIVVVLPVSFVCMSATVAEDGVLEPLSPSQDEESYEDHTITPDVAAIVLGPLRWRF